MPTIRSLLFCLGFAGPIASMAGEPPPFTDDDRHLAKSVLDDMRREVADNYHASARVGKDFDLRCAAAARAIEGAQSNSEANALIADALASVDPRIRFSPPPRQFRVDYSWQWQLFGDEAFVTQVDKEGDAARKGLRIGDKVLSCEGTTLNRASYEQVEYTFQVLAPRPGLRIQVQTIGEEPRWLAVAATPRPQRKIRATGPPSAPRYSWVLSDIDKRHREEFRDVGQHFHLSGNVAIWRALELQRDTGAVADALKRIGEATALILDLRGESIGRHETMLTLLDGLFTSDFDAGNIKRERRFDEKLHVRGRAGAFVGTLLVLVDSETSGYAEVFARIIGQKQRGVIIGDRTKGRMIDAIRFGNASGADFSFTSASVLVPTGEIILAGDAGPQNSPVIPDLLLVPSQADVAARRDVVLAKALAMLKQKITPEEAYRIVHLPSEDDDDNDDWP